MKKIVKHCSLDECYHGIASLIVKQSNVMLNKKEKYTIALSGGNTPEGLFKLLCTEQYIQAIQWHKIHFFWSDERYVPATDPASNYLRAYEHLLAHVPIEMSHIYRVPIEEASCEIAAHKYQQIILNVFAYQKTTSTNSEFFPQFDLILLGMGADGHTASLFPNHRALHDSDLIAAVDSEYAKPQVPRVTFTLPLINSADTVVFMVSGGDKIKVLESFVETDTKTSLIPASMVAPQKQLIWFVAE